MSDHVSHSMLGKYEIRGTLGKGAMGTVYDGRDPVIDRRVAIKTVNLPEGHDEEAEEGLARFKREAQAAGRLHHPNIVGVFDYGETADVAFIVMEFVEGRTLKQLLDTGDRLPLSEVARLMQDILAGLAYSHASGVVHRDIKPANIMLTADRRAKIADFGIARIESSSMTQAGTVLGTPAYMSPEQFMGQVVDRRTDIYSSGVLLYQLLTGERPFEGGLTAIMHKALNTSPPRPSELSVTAPVSLDDVVARAMAKRPEDRFEDADEFSRALTRALEAPAPVGHEADADATVVNAPARAAASPVPPPAPRAAKPPARPPAGKLPLIAAGVLGLVVVGGGGAWFALSGKPALTPPETIVASLPPSSSQSASSPPAAVPAAPSPVPAAAPSPAPREAATAAPPAPSAAPPRAAPVQPAPQAPAPISQALPPPASPVQLPPPLPVVQPTPVAPPAPAPQPAASQPIPPPPTAPSQQAMLQVPTPPPSSPPASAPVAPLAPLPPVQPPRTAAALRANLGSVLPGLACTLPDVSISPAMAATVRGIVGRGGPADALRGAVSNAEPAATDWRVAEVDGLYCPALDTLRPVPGRLAMARADDRHALQDNDVIEVGVTMPFTGYLTMAYLANDGTVSPLVPGTGFPARTYPAGSRQSFGQPRQGFDGWKVGPPFGTDMIVAVASTAPLFTASRPDSQPLDGFLHDLESALDAARKRGANLAANAVVVATQPAK